jgi:hypothetical protein
LPDQIIPDDNPGACMFMTLRDIAQMLQPHMVAEDIPAALDKLDKGEQLALTSTVSDDVIVVFVPDGIGLFRAYINANL